MNRKVKLTHKKRPPLVRSPSLSTLQSGNKPKKSVRFRDSGSLEDVRLFLKSEMPIACQSDPTCSIKYVYHLRHLNWPSVRHHEGGLAVRVENIQFDASHLIGTCQVANLAYEKKVNIRYSFDDWSTCHQVQADYRESIIDTWDRFSFKIKCHPFVRHLDFAVQYLVSGREFWDNNKQQNYQLDITTNAQIMNEEDDESSSSSSEDEPADILWPTHTPVCFDQRKTSSSELIQQQQQQIILL